jgi:hypothetical protein
MDDACATDHAHQRELGVDFPVAHAAELHVGRDTAGIDGVWHQFLRILDARIFAGDFRVCVKER